MQAPQIDSTTPDSTPRQSVVPEAAEVARVVAEWEDVSRESPWHVRPDAFGLDRLHETIAAIMDVRSWSSDANPDVAERLVRSAAAHGEQRRAQAVSDAALLAEYQALRSAIWQLLRPSTSGNAVVLAELLRVDVAISVATTIALRAYHRAELPLGAAWGQDILQQVDAVSRHLADLLQDGVAS